MCTSCSLNCFQDSLHRCRGTSSQVPLIKGVWYPAWWQKTAALGTSRQSKAASLQTAMATSSPYSPVTADTVHVWSHQEFSKPALLTCCYGYKVQVIYINHVLHLMHLMRCHKHSVNGKHDRSLENWAGPIRFCFLKLLFACRQKLSSVVGYSKAALLFVSMIQKSLPRRTLLQRCLVANDPHAAPADCNVGQL